MLLVAALPRAAAADTVAEQIDPAHTGVGSGAPAPPLRERWRRTFDASYPISHEVHAALAAGGRVFTTFQDRNGGPAQLYALNPADGSTLWERDMTGWIGGAGYGNGIVVAAAGEGLHAFHAADGSPAWARTTWTDVEFPSVTSGPLVAGGDTYVVVNGYLFALDTGSGSIEWHTASTSFAGLAAGADRLYVVENQSVKALRRSDGGVIWSSPPPPTTTTFSARNGPTLVGDRLYIPSAYDGAIYDATTGALVKGRFWMAGMAAAQSDRAYVLSGVPYGNGLVLQAVTPSGDQTAWEFGAWRGVASYPVIADDVVYVTGYGNTLYALNKATGDPVWCSPTHTTNYAGDPHTIGVGDGLLLLPVGGELAAFEPGGTPGCSFYASSVPGYTDPIGTSATAARATAARTAAPRGFVSTGTALPGRARFTARNGSHVLSVGASGPTLATVPTDELFGVRSRVSLRLRGARPARIIRGEGRLPGVVNEYRGNDPAAWRPGLRRYSRVRLTGLRRGVDMVVRAARGDRFEYDLVVAPGVGPARIELEFAGAGQPTLTADGQLVLPTPAGRLVQPPPRAYQHRAGRRVVVPARFRLTRAGQVAFDIGAYDRRAPLVIDPVLEWATYFGGGMDDAATAINSDSNGNVYVAGRTASRDLAGVGFGAWNERNAICSEFDPCHDSFVAKYAPDGGLIYVSYLAGRENDTARAVATDAAGNAYVTGYTTSPDFPTQSALQAEWRCGNPYGDAFVTKLSPDGSSLVYSTYVGGCGTFGDIGTAIAVDSHQRAVVAGYTDAFNFPTTQGAADRTCAPAGGFCNDGFVARLSAAGDKLEWSTYFGGDASDEEPYAIALDSQDRPVIAGEMGDWGTSDFPQTPGAYGSNAPVGFSQVFAARLAADGSAIQWAGAFGGEDWDEARSVALDSSDNVYLTGKTESFSFPTTDGALSRLCDGSTYQYACTNHPDAFVSELSADGSQLLASTYLGGGGYETGTGIALDGADRPYVTGSSSSEYGFPLTDAFQPTAAGDFDWCNARADCSDAFLVRLDPTLSWVDYGTLYGGKSQDVPAGVTLADGDAWIAGLTHSPDVATTSSAPQPQWAGGNCHFLRGELEFPSCSDAFVARIDEAKPPAPPPSPPPPDDGSGGTGGSAGNGGAGSSQPGASETAPSTQSPDQSLPGPATLPPGGGFLQTRTINARRALTLRRTKRRLHGRVRSGSTVCTRAVPVVLERRAGRKWRLLARARTTESGRFAFALPRRKGQLRVRIPATQHRDGATVTSCGGVRRRVPSASKQSP